VVYRIGGESGLTADHFLQSEIVREELPFGRKYHAYLDTGRSALYLALQEIVNRGGDREAWLPRYCCDSVIQPFQQLGFAVFFYSSGSDLKTPGRLPDRIGSATFLLIHYFGKKNYPVLNWLDALAPGERPRFIIEDCAQAVLTGNVGSYGDFAIGSYRKFLPQPDGAVLACDLPLAVDLMEPDENFVSARLIGKMVREGGGDGFLELFAQAEERIDGKIAPRRMSLLSRYLFKRTDLTLIRSRRRNNWEYLVGGLKGEGMADGCLTLLFDALEDDEVPLGLPITVEHNRRDELRRYLMNRNIFCPVHWQLREDAGNADWRCESALSAAILTLPTDQGVTESALDYLIATIKFYFNR
jgi:hypothetical protein